MNLVIQIHYWFSYDKDYYKFHQIRFDNGLVPDNVEMLAYCVDPTRASMVLEVEYNVSPNQTKFAASDMDLSKATNKRWMHADGDLDNELVDEEGKRGLPFDHFSVIANSFGIMTRRQHNRNVRSGVYGAESDLLPEA